MQCPECGQDATTLIEGSCPSCAVQKARLLEAPEALPLVVCAHCGRLEEGAHWATAQGTGDEVLLARLRNALKVHPGLADVRLEFATHAHDARHTTVTTRLAGAFHGVPATAEATTLVRVRNGMCPECSRRAGGYFEAVVQVRSDPEGPALDVDAVEGEVRQAMDRLEGREGGWFSNVERVRGGLDFYVGSSETARILARGLADRWGARVTETAKLVGRSRDGRDLYRVTMLLRLPAYGVGDFIELEDRLFKVLGMQKQALRLVDLANWSEVRRDPRRAKGLSLAGRAAQERDAVVVSRQGHRLQVLDPDSYRTLDMDLPMDVATGQHVRVFRHAERLWLVPPAPHARQ